MVRVMLFAAALAVSALGSAQSGEKGEPGKAPPLVVKPKLRNALATETSPYLRMHAHNPTNWMPWGAAAFEKAKKENKLVFLSIGYSSCYWCHVMERESFDHPVIAKILNDHFVCIKVDREERPDVDHVYMTALQTVQGRGGWPLSMFLLADGRPIVGGTYWPREDKVVAGEKSPGFKTVLETVVKIQKESPAEFVKAAESVASATERALDGAGAFGRAIVALDRRLLSEVVDGLKEEFDPEHGGFGNPTRLFSGAKFPSPCRLEFLLGQHERTKDKALLEMVTLTLDKMARGGIYDQIGGGFHRYSTERSWTVPHFEKMLYDNAQLVELYSRAYRHTKNPAYRRVVAETCRYVAREMTSPDGALYSSQDAETEHEEGRFYVWTSEELAEAVGDAKGLAFVKAVYGVGAEPNFEKKFHILRLPKPLAETAKTLELTEETLLARLDPIRTRLYDARAKRARPFRNEVAITAWSGLMIAGLAEAGAAFENREWVDQAKRAAEFLIAKQKTAEGRLLRTYGAAPGQAPKAAGPAYLEDYAFVAHGMLNLHAATGEKRWLDEAASLTKILIRDFGEPKRGGYFLTSHDHEKLFARAKDQHDGAQPSGNSMALRVLVRLAKATGDETFGAEADRGFRFFAGSLKSYGPGVTALASALDLHLPAK